MIPFSCVSRVVYVSLRIISLSIESRTTFEYSEQHPGELNVGCRVCSYSHGRERLGELQLKEQLSKEIWMLQGMNSEDGFLFSTPL